MTITLTALQKQRRDTAANWTAENPTLLAGEIGIESDTGKIKIGTGAAAWNSLAYQGIIPSSGAYPLSQLIMPLGTAAAPAVTFTGDVNTGIYSPGADQLAISTGGSGRLFVDASGNVGIGAATFGAGEKLGVGGTFIVTDGTVVSRITNTAGAGFWGTSTNHPVVFQTNGNERLRITSAGLVGVGTSSPGAPLHVEGETRVRGGNTGDSVIKVGVDATANRASYVDLIGDTTYTTYGLRVVRNGGANGTSQLLHRGTGDYQITAQEAAPIAFLTSNQERLRITSAGLVGIGTSSPDANSRLHVAGGRIVAQGADQYAIQLQNGATVGGLIGASGAGETAFYNTGGVERVRITSGGNVGIGTTSPGENLSIGGGANLYATLTSTGGIKTALAAADANGFGWAGTTTNHAFALFTNNSERARIDSSGRLLVGTSTSRSILGSEAGAQFATTAGITSYIRATADTGSPELVSAKSRGSLATPAIVSDGDNVWNGRFAGYDGASYVEAARITASIDGTPGTNSMPGRIVLSTTAAGASSPTERMRITSDGRVGFGGTPGTGRLFALSSNITGSTTSRAYTSIGQIQSDVTSVASYFATSANTQAASFTLADLRHYTAIQGSFGAGSTVTNQFGYIVESSLTGATNNYGFYSDIASGSNRWNFYANGTAANRFNGNVLIGGTTQPASATLALCLSNGTAPTGSIADGVVLYAEDVSSSSELKVRDEAGNVTTLSPHNFELIPEGPSEDMAWSYYSERDGKRINVDMLKAIRLLEQLTGEKLVFTA